MKSKDRERFRSFIVSSPLFFFGNPFKRFIVMFDVHKPSGIGITFNPAASCVIFNLTAIADRTDAMIIACVFSHILILSFN